MGIHWSVGGSFGHVPVVSHTISNGGMCLTNILFTTDGAVE